MGEQTARVRDMASLRGQDMESVSPVDGQVMRKGPPGRATMTRSVRAVSAFQEWQNVPAPKRGEVVRQIGNALRENKKELGALVSLETGKIIQEGEGEVQEMIDMADFAVGQSRMLYGFSMHSERPRHRMFEQWHPLGPVA